VLVLYRDPLISDEDLTTSGYVVQFEDGLKIDFTLWSVEKMKRVSAGHVLPDEFDAGYRILLDKDGLTNGLKAPTYQAYIPKPPSEALYMEYIESFFLEAIYFVKLLWRDDLMAAKYVLNQYMKHEHLLPMLEWHVEIEHQWTVKTGPFGRKLKKWLRPELWAELEQTYTGPGLEENWESMYRTIDLFRKTAVEVGEKLGFDYPHAIDRRVMQYLEKMIRLCQSTQASG
jgi:aminoglycoside 6-adenylyltransferase